MAENEKTGYPEIDRPWLKYYPKSTLESDIPQCTMLQYMRSGAQKYSDYDAIGYFGRKIKYKKLLEEIDKAAKGFAALGVKRGDIVTVFTTNLPEMVYVVYALNRLGAIFNMEYVTVSSKEAAAAVKRCKSKVIMILDALLEKYADVPDKAECVEHCVVLPLWRSMPVFKKAVAKAKLSKAHCGKEITYADFIKNGKGLTLPEEKYIPDEPAAVLHSGGTTGTPKGVLITNENFNSVAWECSNSGATYAAGDRFFHSIPPFHAFGMGTGVHLPLSIGFCATMMVKFDEAMILAEFEKCKPNHIICAPSQANYILNNTKLKDFSFLKELIIGGADVPNEQESFFDNFLNTHGSKARPMVGYGMSELASAVCLENNAWYGKLGSVGIPFSKSIVKAVDPDTGKDLKYNEEGELWVSGPGLMLGYYENEAETKDAIIVDEKGTRWIHTGDMGHIDEDGFVFITGRMKRIYITRPVKGGPLFKMFPDYITNVILQVEGILECSVVCIPHKEYRALGIAFIVPKSGCDIAELENNIRRHCEEELAAHLMPKAFYFVNCIPHTPIGKPDFHLLEADAQKRTEGMFD